MKLELLIGNIASGKSTYCKMRAEEGAIIVNDDSLVNSLHANNYQLYSDALKPLYKSVENSIISTALSMNLSVIIDRPNHTMSMRRRYVGIAKSFDVPVHAIKFQWEAPFVHAKRRVKSDSRGFDEAYWTSVAQYHEDGYEIIDSNECFDKIAFWNFDDKKLEIM